MGIDTTDFDLFVMSNCPTGQLTSSDTQLCNASGTYNPATSTTSSNKSSSTGYSYADGSSVTMDLFSDTVTLSTGVKMPDLEFGVAVESEGLTNGVLGLGYGETSGTESYPTFMDQLASQGLTKSRAFSLALGSDTTGDTGVIIFGGIDTKKYSGTLASIDINKDPGSSYVFGFYYVDLTSVGISSVDGDSKNYNGSNATVALSTGDTISYLPKAVVDSLNNDIGNGSACFVSGNACLYPVSCSQLQNDSFSVDFAFSDVSLSVPLSEIVLDVGQGTCILGVGALNDSQIYTAALGLNFLRAAYIVFDQTLNKVSLAEYINCGQNEQEMPSSGAAGFEGECQVSTTSPSPSSSPTTSPTSSGLSTGAKAGIGVGVSVFATAAAGLVCFFVLSARRKRRTGDGAAPNAYPGQGTPQLGTGEDYGHSQAYSPPVSELMGSPQSAQFAMKKYDEPVEPRAEMGSGSPRHPEVAELASG